MTAMQETVERVDKLEFLMAQLIEERRESSRETDRKFQETFKEIRELQKETDRKFQETDKQFKETDRKIKETNDRIDRALDRIEKDIKRINEERGNLSNKLGTMVEDLVYPSIERIIEERFGIITDKVSIRERRRVDHRRKKELDAYAVTKDYVFLNSTKATLREKDVDDFLADINAFRHLCPEYNDKQLIGILASLGIDDDVLKYAEETGYMVLGIGLDLMEIKNTKGFEPKRWEYKI
ncbi:hypothetical protein MCHI_000887 [Candidatus Magnetoovum chiemensis]|nr:hypothetical protein MCHI_000887 [Candidatus Magnetoovum chiemensis]